jgi:hypothetical protein
MDHDLQEMSVATEQPPLLDEPTPPLCPGPMPSQIILFWTPRAAVAVGLRAMIDLCRPRRSVARAAAITLPSSDEAR